MSCMPAAFPKRHTSRGVHGERPRLDQFVVCSGRPLFQRPVKRTLRRARANVGKLHSDDLQPASTHSSSETTRGFEPTSVSPSVDSEGSWWSWKYGASVHYVQKGSKGPAILLVHGFGVGSYHFEDNIEYLSKQYRVWAVDLIGQGRSWPSSLSLDSGLVYSTDTWTQQLHDFIQQVIGEPVYVCGNSLGGYLAVSLAANHSSTVRGIILLNATPFWSFAPNPESSPLLSKLMPWNGAVPSPPPLKQFIERVWWSQFSDISNIRTLLRLVYRNPQAADEKLVQRIVDATTNPHALDAFVSIMFAPRSSSSFDAMVSSLECPLCLVYGREDPWVVPLWGQRIKRQRPDALYFEVSPAGHCPHHEAPDAVNFAINTWVSAVEAGVQLPYNEHLPSWELQGVTVSVVNGSPRNIFERMDRLWYEVRARLAAAT